MKTQKQRRTIPEKKRTRKTLETCRKGAEQTQKTFLGNAEKQRRNKNADQQTSRPADQQISRSADQDISR